MSFQTLAALNATETKVITDGSRQTLHKGESVRFTDLPNQPIVLVAYNNTGNTTPYVVGYANQAPKQFQIDSVQGQGFSLGNAFMLNPAVTGANEISVSVPNTAQDNAAIDVYLVSLYLPTSGINNKEIPLNGDEIAFAGYSRSYATPPLQWFTLQISSTETGLVGFLFNQDSITTISVNTPSEIVPAIEAKIYGSMAATGFEPGKVQNVPGNAYTETFYGTSTQYVYSPVSSARTTENGNISLQPNS